MLAPSRISRLAQVFSLGCRLEHLARSTEQIQAANVEGSQLAGPEAGVGVGTDQHWERHGDGGGQKLDLAGGQEVHRPPDNAWQPHPLAGLRASRFTSTAVASAWESTWWALRMRDGDNAASTTGVGRGVTKQAEAVVSPQRQRAHP
jgi:hypothetical protein